MEREWKEKSRRQQESRGGQGSDRKAVVHQHLVPHLTGHSTIRWQEALSTGGRDFAWRQQLDTGAVSGGAAGMPETGWQAANPARHQEMVGEYSVRESLT